MRTPDGSDHTLRRGKVAASGAVAIVLMLAGCGSSAKVSDAIPRSSPEITPPESHGAESAALKKTRVTVISTSTSISAGETSSGEPGSSGAAAGTSGGESSGGTSASTSGGESAEGGAQGGAAAPGGSTKAQGEGSGKGTGSASGGASAPG